MEKLKNEARFIEERNIVTEKGISGFLFLFYHFLFTPLKNSLYYHNH